MTFLLLYTTHPPIHYASNCFRIQSLQTLLTSNVRLCCALRTCSVMIMEDHSEDEEELIDTGGTDLAITKNKADWLYDQAGELIDEDQEQLTVELYRHLLSDKVHSIIQEVLEENRIQYKLQDFQLLTLHSLGSLRNVILVCPTGCGKMLCSYLGTLVLRKVFGKVKGVGLGNQPLSALIEEKLNLQ